MPATAPNATRAVRRAVNAASDDLAAAHERVAELERQLAEAQERIAEFERLEREAAERRHNEAIDAAVNDGRLKKEDTASQDFWRNALKSDQDKAVAALAALPKGAVLAKVTEGTDPHGDNCLDIAARQERAIAEIRDAHPNLDFRAVFAKARDKHPGLFK